MKLIKEIDQTENERFWEIFEFGGFELGFFFFPEKGTDEEQFLCFNFSVSQLICAIQVDSGVWPEVGIALTGLCPLARARLYIWPLDLMGWGG